ncbi:hypothetical protein ACRYCC_00910 [Actinomadura scrupuli]|uniref:hypothetical protein n=1 Tax=Actinomadura scrupuli TaxID=559629 RepID=UPI003D967478
MSVEETDLRTRLHRLTDQPHPVNASVEAARAKGRRIIRWRRAGTVAGTAIAVGAVVFGTVAVLPGGKKATGDNIAGSSSSTARPNPYVQRASFGWLPHGYGPVTTNYENGVFSMAALKGGAATGTQFYFQLFPAGPEPALGNMRGGVPAKAITAPRVNGRAAHWMQPPPPGPGTAPGEARLRIQFGPKQWGELEYDAAPAGTDLKTVLYQVARAIRIQDTPQAFPFQLKGLPAGFKAGNASISTNPRSGGGGWQTSVGFAPGLSILVSLPGQAEGPLKLGRDAPNTTIDGHPAFHEVGTSTGPAHSKRSPEKATGKDRKSLAALGSERLCVYGVHGLDLCYSSTAPAGELLKPSGGLLALYKRTTVFTPNPSTWTTDPLG